MENNKKPVHQIREGLIVASVFENAATNGRFRTVAVSRLYKKDSFWKRSASFGRDDVPTLCRVLGQIHAWLLANPSETPRAAGPTDEVANV